jgi:hypothetical protein
MKELFEKIYIRTEADLPTEEAIEFISHYVNKGMGYMMLLPENRKILLKYIDWYFRPIASPSQELPAEEKLNLSVPVIDFTEDEYSKMSKEELIAWYRKCHKIMLYYATQPRKDIPNEPEITITDEEIEKELNIQLPERNSDYTSGFGKGFIIGAKAMRDGLIKPTK